MEDYPTFLTVPEVAQFLRVTRAAVYGWLKDGTIKGLRIGNVWRIRPEDVPGYVRETDG